MRNKCYDLFPEEQCCLHCGIKLCPKKFILFEDGNEVETYVNHVKTKIQIEYTLTEPVFIWIEEDIFTGWLNSTYKQDMSQALSFSVQREVQLRFLCPDDIQEVKRLCTEWFPIEYPDSWYEDITSSRRFYSLAATYHSRIIGIIVTEIKLKSVMNKEDSDILAKHFPPTVQVAYILSLGVVIDFRRHGIASLLLDSLIQYLTSKESYDCKALYLHVLSSNQIAIKFYEKRRFQAHSFLPYYYSIQGKPRDGYLYVLYVNGGKPPWSPFDYIMNCGEVLSKLQPCALPRQIVCSVRSWFCRLLASITTNYTS